MIARFKADRPGSPIWWVEYLAARYLKLCWTGKPLHYAGRECQEFWGAEMDILDYLRNPEDWGQGVTAPPVCLYGNTTTGTVELSNPTENGYTLTCLCGRHS